jgi:protein-S-isoprenylcysteine O-methyltransferase Ste14
MSAKTIDLGKLKRVILFRFLSGSLILGALLFGSAGTLRYWEGWLYLAVILTAVTAFIRFMIRKDPEALERRMRSRERETYQKALMIIATPVYTSLYIVPPLDHRFGWSTVPVWLVVVGDLASLAGYLLFVRVMLENRFASRVVEIEAEQKLITTGPYAIIRHPMYSAGVLMCSATPLGLGSFWGLLTVPGILAVYVARIIGEEKFLVKGLAGYEDYTQKVRRRLIPGIW